MNDVWNALAREAATAAEHLASGATILGKANYAHHAHYEQAFFALSIGIERATKLALLVDRAIDGRGVFPSSGELRAYGHNLAKLLERADEIALRRGLDAEARLPRTKIHEGIIAVLTDFANNITRYYNLDLVTGDPRAANRSDPIHAWFDAVIAPVLEIHYKSHHRERHHRNAKLASALLEDVSFVSFHSERGEALNTIYAASMQTGASEFSKPFVRMYVMQISRFLAGLLSSLGYAAHEAGLESIPHLPDFFAILNNDDKYFLRRKTWSIYRP
jgi:hypothetical protein